VFDLCDKGLKGCLMILSDWLCNEPMDNRKILVAKMDYPVFTSNHHKKECVLQVVDVKYTRGL